MTAPVPPTPNVTWQRQPRRVQGLYNSTTSGAPPMPGTPGITPQPMQAGAVPAAGGGKPTLPPSNPYVPLNQSTPGTSVSQITPGPGQDLRGTQITPTSDPALNQYMSQAGQATAYVPPNPQANQYYGQAAQVGTGGRIGPAPGIGVNLPNTQYGQVAGPSAYTTAARGGVIDQLAALQNTPDRQALAQRSFNLLQQQTEPQYQGDLRRVAQQAAAMGRQGSGLTTSDLGDVAQRRNQALAQAQEGLSIDTAGQSLADQMARLQAGQGVYGQMSGEDLARAGLGLQGQQLAAGQELGRAGLGLQGQIAGGQLGLQSQIAGGQLGLGQAGLLAGLGQAQQGQTEQERQYGLQRAGTLGGLAGQEYGLGAAGRGELRGERGYQDYLNQSAMQNRIQQQQMEDQLLNSAYGRYAGYSGMLDQAGGEYDPTGLMQQQAGGYQDQANQAFGGAGNALGLAGYMAAMRPPSGYPPGTTAGDIFGAGGGVMSPGQQIAGRLPIGRLPLNRPGNYGTVYGSPYGANAGDF